MITNKKIKLLNIKIYKKSQNINKVTKQKTIQSHLKFVINLLYFELILLNL